MALEGQEQDIGQASFVLGALVMRDSAEGSDFEQDNNKQRVLVVALDSS
jgi:hypothetical protein